MLRRIAAVPEARLAVLAMLTGQAVMVGVMTLTPLHMEGGGQEFKVIGWVISLHIVGMYAFSPIVGWLVDRVGPHLMIGLGGVILFVGAELASHTDPEHSTGLFVGLMMIGLGWSFGLIAGSALLTASFGVSERVEVQGGADFMMEHWRRRGRAAVGRSGGGAGLPVVQPLRRPAGPHPAGGCGRRLGSGAASPPTPDRLAPLRCSR